MNDDTNYRRNRIMNGHSPHRILRMKQKEALEKKSKDIFDIDRFEWELGAESEN